MAGGDDARIIAHRDIGDDGKAGLGLLTQLTQPLDHLRLLDHRIRGHHGSIFRHILEIKMIAAQRARDLCISRKQPP